MTTIQIKKGILFFFLFLVFSFDVFGTDLVFDFRNTGLNYNISYNQLQKLNLNSNNTLLNNSISLINSNLNNSNVLNFAFGDCLQLSNSETLDNGNLVLNSNGLIADRISATGTRLYACILINLNHSYIYQSNTNYTFLNSNFNAGTDSQYICPYKNYNWIASDGSCPEITLENYSFIRTQHINRTFNQILIGLSGDSNIDFGVFKIYQVNITNLLDINQNNLPEINLTFEKACVNDSSDIVDVTYNISSYDFEGDDIYYSTYLQKNFDKNENKDVKYQKKGWFNIYVPDYSFLDYVYYGNLGLCKINPTNTLNTSMLNLVEYQNTGMLALSNICSGYPMYVYDFKKDLDNVFYYTEIYGMQTVNEEFNLTFYDNLLTENLKFKFLVFNNTHMKAFKYNGATFTEISAFSIPATYLYFSVNNYANSTAPYLALFNTGELLNLTYMNKTSTRYVSLSFTGGVMYQKEFSYSGIYSVYNFNLVSDQGTLSDIYYGTNTLRIFYTDDVHLSNDEFLYEDYSFFVDYCKYTDLSVPVDDDKGFNIFPLFDNVLGKSMRSYISGVSNDDLAKSIIWYMFFFTVLALVMFTLFTFGYFDLMFPVLVSSGLYAFISYLMHYTGHLISFMIIFAFTIAIPITSSILGNSNSGKRDS